AVAGVFAGQGGAWLQKGESPMKEKRIFGQHHPMIRLVETELVGHVAEGTVVVRGPAEVPQEVTRLIRMKDRGNFAGVPLDNRNQAVSVEIVSVGTLDSSLVHPREVFKAALLANARAIICAHNHPSGEVDPSDDDLALYNRLASVGSLLGIEILDF